MATKMREHACTRRDHRQQQFPSCSTRGKRSIAIDLKQPGAVTRLQPLLRRADILIEQFRPGVMERLGLGVAAVAEINPRLIYCSITGYGQHGPKFRSCRPGHDLNYSGMAEVAGLLSVISGVLDGAPPLPPALLAGYRRRHPIRR